MKSTHPKALMRPGLFINVVAFCIIIIGILGCNDKKDGVRQSGGKETLEERRLGIKSVADLRAILVKGITTNEIKAKFGNPKWQDTMDDRIFWYYNLTPFPADDEMRGTYVIGLKLEVSNQYVPQWRCIYAGGLAPNTVLNKQSLIDETNDNHALTLKFFTVYDNPVEQGRFVDTKEFPKLGYIGKLPALTIDKLGELTVEQQRSDAPDMQNQSVWVLNFSLDEQFISPLRDLTETNLGNKLLIMVGDEPIATPTIVTPVEDGRFQIKCQDEAVVNTVKKQLAGIVRQK
jgi:hypothetical protein